MKKAGFLFAVLLFVCLVYLLAWPIKMHPQAWQAPENKGYVGDFAANTKLASIDRIELPAAHGPEDIAIGPDGLLYTGLADGRILRVDPVRQTASEIANFNGRPLGLEFTYDRLVIADAYRGLQQLSPEGEQVFLISEIETNDPILYADDLDIYNGKIYFSDASTTYGAKDIGSTMTASVLELWEHGKTGRVVSYDPKTQKIEIVADGLSFANGIAAGPAGSGYILVAETGEYRILKLWVEGPEAGKRQIILDNLPGFPDNINQDAAGGYFVGLVSPRTELLDRLATQPLLRRMIARIPNFANMVPPKAYSHLIRIDEEGRVLDNWQDATGGLPSITGAVRGADGTIYISSLSADHIGVIRP
ncbi:MAG: SMP-30/gluconolactonase/LRE family protein [bacterium]